jgi:uncharacterized membrane protein
MRSPMPGYTLLATILLAIIAVTAPAIAHEDHEQLGAGPGPTANQTMAAPTPASGMQGHAMEAMNADALDMGHGDQADDRRNKSFGERLLSWLGRLHSVVIHFPIAMIVGAFAVELFGWWRGTAAWRETARVMLVVAAIGAVTAMILGWFAGGFYLTDRNPILTIHRWLGTAIAAATLFLVWLTMRSRRDPAEPRALYWWTLGTLTVAVAVQGFLGGTFMHGGIRHLAF